MVGEGHQRFPCLHVPELDKTGVSGWGLCGGDEASQAVGRSHLSREPLGCTVSIYNWMSRGFSEPEKPCV